MNKAKNVPITTNIVETNVNEKDENLKDEKEKKPYNKFKYFTLEEWGKYWIENYGKDVLYNQISGEILRGKNVVSEHELKGYYIAFVSEIQKKGGKKFTKECFYDLVETFAKQINPIKDFLKTLEDAKLKENGHIKTLISCLTLDGSNGMTNEELEIFLTKWFVGCVGQWHETETPNVLMPILSGEKGCGKTYFFRNLLPDNLKGFFVEKTILDDSDKKSEAQKICENLFYYMDDMDSLNKKSEAQIRGMLSTSYLTYKKPYGRGNVRQYRYSNYCGSTNATEIVKDVENNRRIIPIMLKSKNNSVYDSVDKLKFWIEAYQLFKDGFDYQLNGLEFKRVEEISKENEVKDDLQLAILELFQIPIPNPNDEDGNTFEMSASLIKMELDKFRLQYCTLKNVAKTMKKLGFKSIWKKNKEFYLVERIEELQTNLLETKRVIEDSKAKSFKDRILKAS